MSDLAENTLRTAILKTLADDVAEAITKGKSLILGAMQDADSERAAARLPDGTKVASLTVAGGEPSPRITDVAAFEAWVKATHPGETEVIVRDSFRKKCLEDAKQAGRPMLRSSGEMIPGITFERTTPYVAVNFTRGDVPGRELIRRAWRDRVISLPELLEGTVPQALPAGEAGQ